MSNAGFGNGKAALDDKDEMFLKVSEAWQYYQKVPQAGNSPQIRQFPVNLTIPQINQWKISL